MIFALFIASLAILIQQNILKEKGIRKFIKDCIEAVKDIKIEISDNSEENEEMFDFMKSVIFKLNSENFFDRMRSTILKLKIKDLTYPEMKVLKDEMFINTFYKTIFNEEINVLKIVFYN